MTVAVYSSFFTIDSSVTIIIGGSNQICIKELIWRIKIK